MEKDEMKNLGFQGNEELAKVKEGKQSQAQQEAPSPPPPQRQRI